MKNLTFGGLMRPRGRQGDLISKIRKKPYSLCVGGPNPHQTIQHSSSIKKCLKIRGTDSTFGGFKAPQGGQGYSISKIRKSLRKNDGPNPQQKFQHSSLIRKCLNIGGTEM